MFFLAVRFSKLNYTLRLSYHIGATILFGLREVDCLPYDLSRARHIASYFINRHALNDMYVSMS